MSGSILDKTKKALDIPIDLTVFDEQIIMHINSVFSTLNQLGIGPDHGFEIEDNTATWDLFLGTDPRLNMVKTYMALRVRLLFDPPTTSFAIAALDEQRKELEWRMSVVRESWVFIPVGVELDGGNAVGG